jgi:uncharacterized protein (TIGR03663 family)
MSTVENPKVAAGDAKPRCQKSARPQRSPDEWEPLQGSRWQWAAGIILLLAAVLRFYDLSLVPLHHDEGVNGSFLTAMFRGGVYHYDPANYHGPTLYYFALIISTLNAFVFGKAGLSTLAIRSVPAIFGTATVWLVLRLRRYLGDYGALAAALLVAFSPGMVYFSRYFIHEMLLVFFTLGPVVAVLEYYETARPWYLMLASVSAALMFATKETAVFSAIVLVLAWILATVYQRLTGNWKRKYEGIRAAKEGAPSSEPFLVRAGGGDKLMFLLAGAGGLFAAVYCSLYSSFGGNFPKGIYDSFATFSYWATTSSSNHTHDALTCLRWLGKEEWPALCLGALGWVFAICRGRNRFALFSGLWAIGITAAYSLIPYKTPWLNLNIILPLVLIAGYGAEEVFALAQRSSNRRARVIWLLPVVVVLIVPLFYTVDLNFFRYDDDSIPYVYAHTRRGFLDLIKQVEEISTRNGTGTDTGITVASPNHWPMPWYLRDYKKAGYWGKVVPTQEPIVIGQSDQETELRNTLGDGYQRVGFYDLRPGVVLVLYARRNLVQ